MKKISILLTVFAFFVPFLSSSESEGYYSYSYARLSYVKGDVFIQRAADSGYEEGVVNLPVVEGDKLGTREGRVEMHFGKRNYLRVDNNTQVDFASLPQRGDDQIKLHLLSGNIYLRINFLEREKSFEIHTPDASFYILEEGLYRLNVRENRETELLVFRGAMEAAGEEGSLLVEKGQRLIVASGHFSSNPTYFYAELDDGFHQWSEYRDSLLNRRVTKTYLPSELYEYEVELAYNGRWVYERPYGHVWVPYVSHYDWRPYYYGRWIWYPIIGWTWVSYDSWGWCVYHYGRWHWRRSLGWYWIPTRIWGPAWVHWYRGYDYIGWCPLSYYGYPGVIINNYFYGRYYSRYYPLNSRALVVIHKNQLQARRVSKIALQQNQLRRLGKVSLSSKQPGIKPAVNRIRKNSVAAKALSRSNIRKVGKGYVSGKTLISPSRLRSSESRIHSRVSQNLSSSSKARTLSKKAIKSSTLGTSSRVRSKSSSSSSMSKSQAQRRGSSSFSRSTPSRASIKAYPSRRTSSSSKSTFSSSSKSKISFTSKSAKSYTKTSSSSKNLLSGSRIKTYPSRSSSSSKYSPSREYNSGKTGYTGKSNSQRSSSSRSYSSSTRSYTTPSRSYSRSSSSSSRYASPKRSYSSGSSSSRSYSSSSRSTASRSSSSRSSSGSRTRKK